MYDRVPCRRAASLTVALLLATLTGCITPSPEGDFCRQALIEVCANSCQGTCIRERRSLPVAAARIDDAQEIALEPPMTAGAVAVAY